MPRTTVVRGERIELPNTLAEIRAALPEERRAEFDKVIYETPLDQLERRALIDWALPPEAHEDDDEASRRIKAGDFGFAQWTDSDGNAVPR
ncbi:hypothetical protein B4N89_29350 [Embleya scabrispora]|uniref:Uncharacterized protein n=1 Tax=Embleya scabrispora TaxID=159449 RepID=A0A1T3P5V7_9ACTN|nr:hypothetical protein [Embleya scabrispora]OPC84487.1 hypothetical protein B4N89_29350 [Embleya scabrispora]